MNLQHSDEQRLVTLAQSGDTDAFTELIDPFRRELQVHCYRILGSVQDAEDAVQETLTSAWRALGDFRSQSSIRTWLHRIATNRSLNMLRANTRRTVEPDRPPAVEPPPPTRTSSVPWLQPLPDQLLADLPDTAPRPDAVWESREMVSLAFITALQLLPPRQRAVLILRDVLGYPSAETADLLETTHESVASALKRARTTLADNYVRAEDVPAAGSPEERALVARFTDAFTNRDVETLVALLTEDAWIKMPPLPFEYQGRDAARRFLDLVALPEHRRVRIVHTRANKQPACVTYVADDHSDIYHAVGVLVLSLRNDRISEITRFDTSVLPMFGVPRVLHTDAS